MERKIKTVNKNLDMVERQELLRIDTIGNSDICPTQEEVIAVMSVLTDKQLYIMRKRYFEAYTLDEIAVKLGVTRETIRTTIVKSLHKMKIELIRSKPKAPKKLCDMEVCDLKLSNRSANTLGRYFGNRRATVGKLTKLTTERLRKIRGIGVKCAAEIIDKIHELGLKFADEV